MHRNSSVEHSPYEQACDHSSGCKMEIIFPFHDVTPPRKLAAVLIFGRSLIEPVSDTDKGLDTVTFFAKFFAEILDAVVDNALGDVIIPAPGHCQQ